MENAVAAKDEEATDDNVTEVDSADDNVTQCEEEVETATVGPPDLGEARLLCEVVPPSCLPPGPADPEVATVRGDVAPGPTVELEVGDGPEGGDPGGGADGDATEAPTALPAAAEGGGARHLDAMQRLLLQTQAELQEAQAALALHRQGLLPKSSGPPPPYSWLASSGASSSSAAAPEPPTMPKAPPTPSVPSGRYPSSNPSVQMYKKTNCTPEERRQRDLKIERETRRKRRRQQERDDQNRPRPPP